jgi:hypothetical protein
VKRRSGRRRPAPARRATALADYAFRQRFRVPAEWAFRWCIDYAPDDWASAPTPGTRRVRWLSERTVRLEDTFPASGGGTVRKVKLVQVYPEQKSWVSNHIVSPNLHSQFRYSISPDGPSASVLRFEGRELHWTGPRLSAAENARLSRTLRTEDSAEWRRLAAEMERDYRDRSRSSRRVGR